VSGADAEGGEERRDEQRPGDGPDADGDRPQLDLQPTGDPGQRGDGQGRSQQDVERRDKSVDR
jgi:hypothetical protein